MHFRPMRHLLCHIVTIAKNRLQPPELLIELRVIAVLASMNESKQRWPQCLFRYFTRIKVGKGMTVILIRDIQTTFFLKRKHVRKEPIL